MNAMAAPDLHLKPLAELDERERLAVLAIRNEPGVRANMYTDHEIGEAEHAAWVARTIASDTVCFYAVLHEGAVVGAASLTHISRAHRRADWAFYLSAACRGKGLGGALERRMLHLAFVECGLEKLNCEVIAFNETVIALHRRFGFIVEGTRRRHVIRDGKAHDAVLLGLTRDEWLATGAKAGS